MYKLDPTTLQPQTRPVELGDLITEEDTWRVIDMYFEKNGLVGNQIESFDQFILHQMQEIIDQHHHLIVHPSALSQEEAYCYVFKFGQVYCGRPSYDDAEGNELPLDPQTARLRNFTYASSIKVDLRQERYKGDCRSQYDYATLRDTCELTSSQVYERVPLGRIPIMLRSTLCYLNKDLADDQTVIDKHECLYDQGGYFVINGTERCLIGQERMANNFVYCFKKENHKYSWFADIRSQQQGMQSTSPCRVVLQKGTNKHSNLDKAFFVEVPGIHKEIPLVILLRALGRGSDQDIVRMVCYNAGDQRMLDMISHTLAEGQLYPTKELCLDFIARRGATIGDGKQARLTFARETLNNFLPHIGRTAECDVDKSWFLGYMVHRICLGNLGRIPQDDRDHMGKKRIDLAGQLVGSSFGALFRKLAKNLRRSLQQKIDDGKPFDVATLVRLNSQLTSGLLYEFATGNWARKQDGTSARQGVSQVLNRLTYMSALSHLRRLNTPLGREGKVAKPRQLHNTTWGMICPCETPEGQAVGLVKNMALMCEVSGGVSSYVSNAQDSLLNILEEVGLLKLSEVNAEMIYTYYKCFVNGKWVGILQNGQQACGLLQDLRRHGELSQDTSIILDGKNREIRIFTDPGRVLRPLLVVNQGNRLALTKTLLNEIEVEYRKLQEAGALADKQTAWDLLKMKGVVEFLDPEEEETSMIATFPDHLETKRDYCSSYTHCEMHPTLTLGVCASVIPFPDHNQSPRNVYQSAMGKQAMGLYATNYQRRLDTSSNVLFYPQKPLVCTRPMRYFNFAELPSGVNCLVAIMAYTGYNQEDSLIMSQAAIDRGMFRSMFVRSYSSEEKFHGTTLTQYFKRPDPMETVGMRRGDYSRLDADGLVAPGCRVGGDDILMGRVAPLDSIDEQFLSQPTKNVRDCSVTVRATEAGTVDEVCLTTNAKGIKLVKVRLRSTRIPQIGDKFASRHGQKGTIGLTLPTEDLPFTADGIAPDIIMNPHAIPSRMTIGHLIECLLGKLGTVCGFVGDATAFRGQSVFEIADELHSKGYQRYGNECLYSGFTGQPLPARIFIGPTYYQRLKHMVDDKIHSRARGPITMLTRQPLEGRARDGGLRFGEMERDCMISHGAASMLKERLFHMSDAYRLHICKDCSTFSEANTELESFYCRPCNSRTSVRQIHLPYACKLLIQELKAMHIMPKLVLEK